MARRKVGFKSKRKNVASKRETKQKLTKPTSTKDGVKKDEDGLNGNRAEPETNIVSEIEESELICNYRKEQRYRIKEGERGKTMGGKSRAKESGSTTSVGFGRGINASKTKVMPEEESAKNASTPGKKRRSADEEIAQAFVPSPEKGSYDLRVRRGVSSFLKVSVGENNFGKVIGKRVTVYWSGDRKWYTGKIKSYDDETKCHRVLYDDGDVGQLNLKKQLFKIEVMPGEAFSLSSKGGPNARKKELDSDGSLVSAESKEEGLLNVGNAEPVEKHPRPKRKATTKAAKEDNSKKLMNIKATKVTENGVYWTQRGKVIRDEQKDVVEASLKAAKKQGLKSQKGENIVDGKREGPTKNESSRSQKGVDLEAENKNVEETQNAELVAKKSKLGKKLRKNVTERRASKSQTRTSTEDEKTEDVVSHKTISGGGGQVNRESRKNPSRKGRAKVKTKN